MKAIVVCALLGSAATAAGAQDVPVWQRLLRWWGGESSETSVPSTTSAHLQMSTRRTERPGDAERAEAVVAAARRVLVQYRDVQTAERDGYRPFAPRGVVGEEIHYTNGWKARREAKTLDLDRPGSILYRRTEDGLVAVGVMYGAPADATAEQLDARLPTSRAVWHRHVDYCGWPNGTPKADYDGPGARFGFAGSIDTEAACKAAGGYWIPLVLGWMTHVYPNETDADRVWLGEHAMTMHDGGHDHAHGHSSTR